MRFRTLAFVALLAVGSSLAAPPSAAAQASPPRTIRQAFALDSGSARNESDAPQAVLSFYVNFDGAASLALYFDEVQLSGSVADGTASTLRITSLQDGAQQTMNAEHVRQWNHGSAYFNGDTLLVEVLAFPGTGDNRVSIEALEVGIPFGPLETQCGPLDDRVPSNDPRVARLMPVVCTAWMINDCGKCFLSAGHCGGGTGASVQFNVPFSTTGGALVFPPPEDQYAVDPASHQSLFSTDDWKYFGCFPNSNTGLTPWQAMGAAFDLVTPPAPAGNSIRITGYGADSTPNLTYDNIQQTHVGPFVSSGVDLGYQADTTGGNSGSPIIWEQQNVAIGIHTNGGCSTSGSGANTGTPITSVSLQAALANPLGVCAQSASVADLGFDKTSAPFTRAPELSACGNLTAGSSLTIELTLLVPPAATGYTADAYLIVGGAAIFAPFSGGTLVPQPTLSIKSPMDLSSGQATNVIAATWPAGVPSGSSFWMQTWVPFTNGSVSGTLASNALKLTTP